MSIENETGASRVLLLTLLDQIEDLLKDVREAVLNHEQTDNEHG